MLYTSAFSVFGVTKTLRKHVSPWYTDECEQARHVLKYANKQYRRLKTFECVNLVIGKRRLFRQAKRRAKFKYNRSQRETLHTTATNNPKQFWDLIRKNKNKYKKNNSDVPSQEFYEHFKTLFSEYESFTDNDVENVINNDTFCDQIIDQLDCDFNDDDVIKAINSLKRGTSP
ncbi:hypothetical protein MAR_007584, partial [Mya arenaria]